MTNLSATNTLNSYINTELQELSTPPLSTICSSTTSISTSSPSLQNAINKQLNDLKIQFKNGIKHLQYKEPSISLQPSLSMPQLPLFCDKSFNQKLKMNKKKRKKPIPLKPFQDVENINMINLSSSSSSTSSNISSVHDHRNNMNNNLMTHNNAIENNEINQKLDLLINIINSQQKLLEHLIAQNVKKKQKKPKKAKKKSRSTQTNNMPHIIQSDASKQDSPAYPPIPQSQSVSNNNNNNIHKNINNNVNNAVNDDNVLVPYDTLIKLVSSAANNHAQYRSCQYDHVMPMHQQYIYRTNNNNNNNKHLMSPKSTLYFSDC